MERIKTCCLWSWLFATRLISRSYQACWRKRLCVFSGKKVWFMHKYLISLVFFMCLCIIQLLWPCRGALEILWEQDVCSWRCALGNDVQLCRNGVQLTCALSTSSLPGRWTAPQPNKSSCFSKDHQGIELLKEALKGPLEYTREFDAFCLKSRLAVTTVKYAAHIWVEDGPRHSRQAEDPYGSREALVVPLLTSCVISVAVCPCRVRCFRGRPAATQLGRGSAWAGYDQSGGAQASGFWPWHLFGLSGLQSQRQLPCQPSQKVRMLGSCVFCVCVLSVDDLCVCVCVVWLVDPRSECVGVWSDGWILEVIVCVDYWMDPGSDCVCVWSDGWILEVIVCVCGLMGGSWKWLCVCADWWVDPGSDCVCVCGLMSGS